ncbi:MAG: aldose 1-epimerase [Paracoccus sp. (in: a-proteobacteria)]
MPLITLRSGPVSARITTRGGCLLRLDHGDIPLLRPAAGDAGPLDSACYPLVPFGNRVRGNRFHFAGREYRLEPNTDRDPHYLHGQGWLSAWKVTRQSADSVALSHVHDGSALPYTYEAGQRITVLPDGAILEISVINRGDRVMPFGIGLHPFFPLTPQATLRTGTGRMWTEDPGHLPGGPVALPTEMNFSAPRGLPGHRVNNGFEDWSGKAEIRWPERGAALHIKADPVFRCMFLFKPDTVPIPGHPLDFFALEPMSHLADGHNHDDLGGLAALAPGEALAGAVHLRLETSQRGARRGTEGGV